MKRFSKVLTSVLVVCLLFAMLAIGASADEVPNTNYQKQTAMAGKMTTRPVIDGKIGDGEWATAGTIEFTKDALTAGAGHLWAPTDDGGLTFWELPDDGDGKAYLAWDEEYFYLALDVDDAQNTNNEGLATDCWKGDCLQLAIGANILGARHEYGFALSTFGGGNGRQLGYRWYPTEENMTLYGVVDMAKTATQDVYFYVGRNGKRTVYEIALKYNYIGCDKKFSEGTSLPLAFALHLYENNKNSGYFMEWADGVIGGTEDKQLLNMGAVVLSKAQGNGKPVVTTTTTTTTKKPTTTTTKKDDVKVTTTTTKKDGVKVTTTTTKKPDGGNKVTTKPIVTTTTTTKKADGGNVVTTTTTTTTTTVATTTTTEAPDVAGVYNYNLEDASDVTDEAILSELAGAFTDKELVVKAVVSAEEKIGNILSDNLLGVYVKDEDGKLVAVESITETAKDENGEDIEVVVYEVGKDATVYVVEEVIPTTTTITTTTTTAATAPVEADVTTTATEKEPAGSLAWLWIVLGAVVVAGAAVAIVLVLKKKNGAQSTDTPTEE